MKKNEYVAKADEYDNKYDMDLRMCANCYWWDVSEKEFEKHDFLAEGFCHRYPPATPCVSHINSMGITVLEEPKYGMPLLSCPMTFGEEWCGEFKWAVNLRWTE